MTGRELLGDRYELRGVLGVGGMAEVCDAWDTRLNRPVAVKMLHPALVAQPDVRLRFHDEARAAAALCHPNIVAVHDYGEQDGTPYIVMERLPGTTLGDLSADGPLPPDRVRAHLDEILAALAVAHAAGVLHRDIKPGNVLVTTSGDGVKVADFGIAKTGGAAHTMTGQLVGTLSYMSPERVTGAPASPADDIYAVGVMGYELLTGERAFPQDTPIALARAIVDAPPPPLHAVRPDLDAGLAAVIDRAMERDPARRFASAEQMRAALHGDQTALVAGLPVRAPVARTDGDITAPIVVPRYSATRTVDVLPPPSAARRTKGGLAAAAVLGCLAVAAVALAAEPFTATPPPTPISTSTPVPTPESRPTPAVLPPPPAAPTIVPVQETVPDDAPIAVDAGKNNGGNGNGGKGHGGGGGGGNAGKGNGNGGAKGKH